MTQRTLLNPNPAPARKGGAGRIVGRVLTYVVLIAWSLFTIFAFTWITLASLKTNREIFRDPFRLPANPQWQNYANAWNSVQMGTYFVNSVIIVGTSLVLLMAVSAPAAYILSRFKFRGGGTLKNLFTVGMGIPFPLLFIPLFAILTAIRLINTMPGLILIYVSLSIPFTVYLLTGFFASLPRELEEAAVIDGSRAGKPFGT